MLLFKSPIFYLVMAQSARVVMLAIQIYQSKAVKYFLYAKRVKVIDLIRKGKNHTLRC